MTEKIFQVRNELKINRATNCRTVFNRILYLWNNLPDDLRIVTHSVTSIRRALDRVKSMSAQGAHSAVKGLSNFFST